MPKKNLLNELCQAISVFEGGPKDLNHRLNNPGNCRYFSGGYAPIYGVVERDKSGFAKFKDWYTGFLYLMNMIKGKATKKPNQTLQQFMNSYAPSTDGNDPIKYATFLASRLNVDKDVFKMGDLL